MGRYEEYIKGLRGQGTEGDFDKLKKGVEARVGRQKVFGRLAAAGTLMVFIFSLGYYLGPYFFASPVTIADYVFEQSETNGNQVLNYVFADR